MTSTDIVGRILRVRPQHSAILPSEMLFFCREAVRLGVVHVIESGRAFGYSTEVLCQFPWRVTSIEHSPDSESDKRLERYANLTKVKRSCEKVLAELLQDEPTAVLLDGPKGLVAYKLFRTHQRGAMLWAIHDACPNTEIRAKLAKANEGWRLSDEPLFLQKFGDMDMESLRMRGYGSHGELLSVANVLAVWVQAAEDFS